MFHRFLEWFASALLAAIYGLIAFLSGAFVTEIAMDHGSNILILASLAGATFIGFLSVVSTRALCEQPSRKIVILISLIAIILSLLSPISSVLNGHNRARELRNSAPSLVEFAIAKFNDIDKTGDGQLTDDELASAIESNSFNESERKLLTLMRDEISIVGHIVDSQDYVTVVVLPQGGLVPVIHESYKYGINQADLHSYIERVNKKFRNW